jgi:hypothetical protein
MRRAVIATAVAASVFATTLPAGPPTAWAQDTKPAISVDVSSLPPLPPLVSADQRRRAALIATGAGAVIAVFLADIVTGGMLLAPLGVPSATSLFESGAAAAPAAPAMTATGTAAVAIAAPTYTVAQQVLAGVASFAAAVGGGYIGSYLGRARPDLVGLQE